MQIQAQHAGWCGQSETLGGSDVQSQGLCKRSGMPQKLLGHQLAA